MSVKTRTAKDDGFLFCEDVMQITGFKRTKAYTVIKDLNAELREKGFYTFDGRIPRKYFEERTGLRA